jgi:hypothetical protein
LGKKIARAFNVRTIYIVVGFPERERFEFQHFIDQPHQEDSAHNLPKITSN